MWNSWRARAMATFSKRYGFTPTAPITVEIYPNHDDFAVRTAGLPGIGLLGVTFGDVVAMDSPSGRKSGDFHWGSTLWHEMAHVFTLSVPRTSRAALAERGLVGIRGVDHWPDAGRGHRIHRCSTPSSPASCCPSRAWTKGFMRPTYENQVQISYKQAGLVCLFADQRWGFAEGGAVPARLQRRSRPRRRPCVRVFEVEPEQFDKEFDAFMKQRFAAYIADPKRWTELMRRGRTDARGAQLGRRARCGAGRHPDASRIHRATAVPTRCWPRPSMRAGNDAARHRGAGSSGARPAAGILPACASSARCCWPPQRNRATRGRSAGRGELCRSAVRGRARPSWATLLLAQRQGNARRCANTRCCWRCSRWTPPPRTSAWPVPIA